jgi:hypothetical protein
VVHAFLASISIKELMLNFGNWSSPRWLLKQEVPKIVKSINRQLREKSIKTKVEFSDIIVDHK